MPKGYTRIELGVYRTPERNYWVRATACHPRTGRRINRSATLPKGATLREARVRLVELREEIDQLAGIDAPIERCRRRTLADCAERWMAAQRDRVRPGTARLYADLLGQHILPAPVGPDGTPFGELYIDHLGRSDIDRWCRWAERHTQSNGRLYAKATVEGWWRVLCAFIRDSVAEVGLDDPINRVKPPRIVGRPKCREQRTLNREQLARLVRAVVARNSGDPRSALTVARAEAAAAEARGDRPAALEARFQEACALQTLGRSAEAQAVYEGLFGELAALGARRLRALTLGNLGIDARRRGDDAAAEAWRAEACALLDALGDRLMRSKISALSGAPDAGQSDAVGDEESRLLAELARGDALATAGERARAAVVFDQARWTAEGLRLGWIADAAARNATSGFARLPEPVVERVVRDVAADLESGAWDERNGHHRALAAYDGGLRKIVHRP